MQDILNKKRLPMSFYTKNGTLAEKIMVMIAQETGTETTIKKIKEMALKNEQEVMGEPTFARAVIELIKKVKADPLTTLHLISDTAKITIIVRDLKSGQLY